MSFGFRREDCTPPLPRSVRTRPSADWPFRSVRAEDLEGLPAEDMLVIERHMQWVIAQRRRS